MFFTHLLILQFLPQMSNFTSDLLSCLGFYIGNMVTKVHAFFVIHFACILSSFCLSVFLFMYFFVSISVIEYLYLCRSVFLFVVLIVVIYSGKDSQPFN